jgi:aarF domain-containing kinase
MLPMSMYGRTRGIATVLSRCRVPRSKISVPPVPFARRCIQTGGGPFQPLRPPSPSELGAPRAAKEYKKPRKWARRLAVVAVVGGVIYVVDRQVYASGILRSLRTFTTGLIVAIDYKLNFRADPWVAGSIQDLHMRSAERIFNLLQDNGGYYLKIGQAIAMQSAVLPPEFQKMFARMFDDAPQDEWHDVEAVIKKEFGKSVEEVFGVSFTGKEGMGVMERKARASASVAQVHWAKLPDGREVAIKIQKREIEKQRAFDMWSFK